MTSHLQEVPEQANPCAGISTVVDAAGSPRLRRTLQLKDLLIYGIVIISPLAPMTIFGLLSQRGKGHVVTTILIAMVAMVFTGISYGRMARAYPSAGSAFTYVAREIHPSLGYIIGWGMLMDYILNPLLSAVLCAELSHNYLPMIPVAAWKIAFATYFTLVNIHGIRTSARINSAMALGQGAVVIAVLIAGAHYVFIHPHPGPEFFTRPFYDPQTYSFGGILGATSIAVMAYMGFDGISTLSEETERPERNILRAIVLTCLVIGIISAAEVYVAQLIWPASEGFPDADTAYVAAMSRAWEPLSPVVGFTILLGCVGSGTAAQLGAARLLYGMGRSNALPRRFFGVIDPKHHIPRNNVLFIGAIALSGTLFLSFALGVEMQNFGALIAFMGVNAAAFLRYFVRAPQKKLRNLLPSLLGFLVCLALWWGLSSPAKILGSIWMGLGVGLGVWMTRGFRIPLSFEVPKQ